MEDILLISFFIFLIVYLLLIPKQITGGLSKTLNFKTIKKDHYLLKSEKNDSLRYF